MRRIYPPRRVHGRKMRQIQAIQRMPRRLSGLSGRLLWLTVAFVDVCGSADLLSIHLGHADDVAARPAGYGRGGRHCHRWSPGCRIAREVQDDTLLATGNQGDGHAQGWHLRLLAATDVPPQVDEQFDLAHESMVVSMRNALDTLVFGGDRVIRVFGPIGESDMIIELVNDR